MFNIFFALNPVLQAFIAGMVTFIVTSLGSAIVFFFKQVNKNFMDGMLGLSAGVMIAASFFSLLNPAIIISENLGFIPWLVLSIAPFYK